MSFFYSGAKAQGQKVSTMAFYNVENLFDTSDDTLTNDDDYLPWGYKAWDQNKLRSKIIKLGKVIVSIGEFGPPDVLGICEVENRYVIDHLLENSALAQWDMGVVHENSNDRRGIDVAMIYRKSSFRLLDYKYFRIDFQDSSVRSRPVLMVKGVIKSLDTVHIFVNHWPSRYGGYKYSEWKRELASQKLKAITDSLISYNRRPAIIIMGDFNDDPDSPSVIKLLNNTYNDSMGVRINLFTLKPCKQNDKLVNGTLKYKANWYQFDQIIVSNTFLENISDKGLCMHLFFNEMMLVRDKKFGGYKPFRTYVGPNYTNGFSDHLPVFITFTVKNSR